jgi:DNA/RNA-binding domain of Phe-tRNA-synthetase-like protein
MLDFDEHPRLHHAAFTSALPAALAELPSPGWLTALLAPGAAAPVARDDELRAATRRLLRHGGYKPSGRGKPSAEYLARAADEGTLSSINLAVDACNVASYHSGVPISVVDTARARPPYRVGIPDGDPRYVFNASGQEIRLGGLLCLFDAEGPCANAVKDSQRTKTSGATRATLSVLWGSNEHADAIERTLAWYRELLERAGARTQRVGAG